MKVADYRGFAIHLPTSGGKAGKGRNVTGTLQARNGDGCIVHTVRFKMEDGSKEAAKTMREWIDNERVFNCADCEVHTGDIGEYYMLTDDVWHAATHNKPARMLCIECVEKRLGRKLTADDFANVPLNHIRLHSKMSSDRIRNRLAPWLETSQSPV